MSRTTLATVAVSSTDRLSPLRLLAPVTEPLLRGRLTHLRRGRLVIEQNGRETVHGDGDGPHRLQPG